MTNRAQKFEAHGWCRTASDPQGCLGHICATARAKSESPTPYKSTARPFGRSSCNSPRWSRNDRGPQTVRAGSEKYPKSPPPMQLIREFDGEIMAPRRMRARNSKRKYAANPGKRRTCGKDVGNVVDGKNVRDLFGDTRSQIVSVPHSCPRRH